MGAKTSHLIITSGSLSWVLSIIYNSHHLSNQTSLWNSLSTLSPLNLPWLMAGDFNAIVSTSENKGGQFQNYLSKSRNFSNFIAQNNHLV